MSRAQWSRCFCLHSPLFLTHCGLASALPCTAAPNCLPMGAGAACGSGSSPEASPAAHGTGQLPSGLLVPARTSLLASAMTEAPLGSTEGGLEILLCLPAFVFPCPLSEQTPSPPPCLLYYDRQNPTHQNVLQFSGQELIEHFGKGISLERCLHISTSHCDCPVADYTVYPCTDSEPCFFWYFPVQLQSHLLQDGFLI